MAASAQPNAPRAPAHGRFDATHGGRRRRADLPRAACPRARSSGVGRGHDGLGARHRAPHRDSRGAWAARALRAEAHHGGRQGRPRRDSRIARARQARPGSTGAGTNRLLSRLRHLFTWAIAEASWRQLAVQAPRGRRRQTDAREQPRHRRLTDADEEDRLLRARPAPSPRPHHRRAGDGRPPGRTALPCSGRMCARRRPRPGPRGRCSCSSRRKPRRACGARCRSGRASRRC